jgi:hypothetical protein
MSSKQDILRSRLYAFHEIHKGEGKTFIWQHFKAEGAKKATINRLMRRIDAGETLIRKKGTGKKPIFDTPKKRAQVARKFNHSRDVSLRKQAKKLKCSHTTIQATNPTHGSSSKMPSVIFKIPKTPIHN